MARATTRIDWTRLWIDDPVFDHALPLTHRPGDAFIRGPLSRQWVVEACRLPGVGLHVCLLLLLIKARGLPRGDWDHGTLAELLRVRKLTVVRAIRAAVGAGVVTRGGSHGFPRYGLPPSLRPADRSRRARIRGPLPWRWWYPAVRLPGSAAHVSVALWLRQSEVGRRRFEFSLTGWGELGISRSSVDRGLRSLESAGLVDVQRRRGRDPVVTLLDPDRPGC
jgi:DNA-binding transcriptional ArsR family regulator